MRGKTRVILADSDGGLLQVLGKVLRLEGYQVVTCSTGMEVVREASASPPSLVVCGYFLPLLDGLKVCMYLKMEPSLAPLPFVLLSPGMDSRLRYRAEWAGAERVMELPVRTEEFLAVCRSLTGDAGPVLEESISRGRSLDRETVLEKLCVILESRVNRLEANWKLTEELSRTVSVRELFRKTASGVLSGLAFDRVWLARYLEQTDELVTEIARGRNLSGIPDSIHVREQQGLPAAVAVRDMVQVRSLDVDLPDERLWWAGSVDYVDTPLIAAGRVVGLIRCDRLISERSVEQQDMEALRQYASHAAEAVLNAMILEDVADEREEMSAIMNSLDSGILVVDNSGLVLQATSMVAELFGRDSEDLKGRKIGDALPELVSTKEKPLSKAMSDHRAVQNIPIELSGSGRKGSVLNVSYMPFERSGHFAGVVIMLNDVTESHTLRENLRKKNEQLETISQIGSELNSTQDLDRICQEVIKALRRFFPSEAVTVFLAEGNRENLTPDSVKAAATAGYDRENDPEGMIIKIDLKTIN